MYFVGTKSVYVLLCPLPGSVVNYISPVFIFISVDMSFNINGNLSYLLQ